MTEEIEYEQLDRTAAPANGGAVALDRVGDIPMQLSVELGRTQATVSEVLTLAPGAVVTLDTLAGEEVDLLANGTAIARGEVVVVGDKLGLRVKEIVEVESDALAAQEQAAQTAPDGPPGGADAEAEQSLAA